MKISVSNEELALLWQVVNTVNVKGVNEAQLLTAVSVGVKDAVDNKLNELELNDELFRGLLSILDKATITGINTAGMIVGLAQKIMNELNGSQNEQKQAKR